MSIRFRLTLWHAAIFALCLAVFALVVWFGTREVLYDDIDTWLARQGDGLAQFLRMETHGTGDAAVAEEAREFSSGLPKGSGIRLFNHEGKLLFTHPDIAIEPGGDRPTTVEQEGASLRVVSQSVIAAGQEFRFAIWRSLDETDLALSDLRRVLTTLIPIFLLLSIAGGWFLSRRALRPVDELTEAARRISLQNLPAALPVPPHRDELQRLCQAWNEMLGRLDTSASQLKQVTADASHELRSPVAFIRTTAELALRRVRSSEEYRAALEKIRTETEEMTQIIENLMELARADSGQSAFHFRPLGIRDLLIEIASQIEPSAIQKNVDLSVGLPDEQLTVMADRSALKRAVLILADNAIKFTSKGRVSMRAFEAAGEVVVEVEDTGVGISDQDLPRIFDRFYQADRSRSSGGAGLGLSIAQWIVQGHHGRIGVESDAGQGSVFRVFLPLAANV